ncbi:4-hydroxy-tetrahydrodipicolinate synthase [Ekhidna sp.]
MRQELKGTGVALATPMNKDYGVDFPALEKLINHTIDGGVDYLVVLGTTGESPVFSWEEKLEILDFVFKVNADRKPIVFGLGGNHTFDLIEKSKDLKKFELSAILSASPYYNKPSQEGIVRHYEMLADAFPFPIILYNVPARTASNIIADTTLTLAKHPNIIAIKEASWDLDQCKKIAHEKPSDFLLISGDDALTYKLIKEGAEGVISVISNLLPAPFINMVSAALQNSFEEAERIEEDLKKAYELLSQEGNPTSLKAGLEVKGICRRTVKPPLYNASENLIAAWEHYLK